MTDNRISADAVAIFGLSAGERTRLRKTSREVRDALQWGVTPDRRERALRMLAEQGYDAEQARVLFDQREMHLANTEALDAALDQVDALYTRQSITDLGVLPEAPTAPEAELLSPITSGGEVANTGFTLIGPGGEGQASERPGAPAPAVIDAGPPTQEPVDLEELYRRLGYDPQGLGRIARALENPGAAMKARAMPDEAWAAVEEEARKGTFRLYSTESDAFRHAYASYRLTQEVGPRLAKNFGDANEISRADNPPEEILMDIYNNNIGRALALDPDNATRPAAEVILEAMRQGNLQLQPFTIKP